MFADWMEAILNLDCNLIVFNIWIVFAHFEVGVRCKYQWVTDWTTTVWTKKTFPIFFSILPGPRRDLLRLWECMCSCVDLLTQASCQMRRAAWSTEADLTPYCKHTNQQPTGATRQSDLTRCQNRSRPQDNQNLHTPTCVQLHVALQPGLWWSHTHTHRHTSDQRY